MGAISENIKHKEGEPVTEFCEGGLGYCIDYVFNTVAFVLKLWLRRASATNVVYMKIKRILCRHRNAFL